MHKSKVGVESGEGGGDGWGEGSGGEQCKQLYLNNTIKNKKEMNTFLIKEKVNIQ